MKKYRCTVCDYIYDPAVGDPDSGIAPGTAFEDLPDDWSCPLCGVGKDMFEPAGCGAEPAKKAGVFTPAFVFYFGSLFLSRASRNSLRGRPPA